MDRFLRRCGALLSLQAWLVLFTLLVFAALALSFASARAELNGRNRKAANIGQTRGVTALRPQCAHVALGLRADATVDAVSQLLRSQDATINYGPDEFDEFQVRINSGDRQRALANLAASPLVRRTTPLPDCP